MTTVTTCEIVERLPVVMLYDHFSSVGVAMATYSHLTRELGSEFKTELRVWRLDVATSSEYSAAANHDIAAAEVIIMTVRGDQPWPAAFRHWKAGANQESGLLPHAVITLINAEDSAVAASGSWNNVLRAAATQIHPEVFVYEARAHPEEWSLSPFHDSDPFMDECYAALDVS